ncbi:hypothetical protein [Neisseria sp. HMSC070H10]|nr:hypothetical protein [Neisseria sp. HMSC070H10]
MPPVIPPATQGAKAHSVSLISYDNSSANCIIGASARVWNTWFSNV